MFDSYAKIPEGILSGTLIPYYSNDLLSRNRELYETLWVNKYLYYTGHINPMGDFDECVNMKARDVTFRLDENKDKYKDVKKEFGGRYCTVYMGIILNRTKSHPELREAVDPEELLVSLNYDL